ncbi:MAG: hypothetical protein IKN55_09515 [Oscillospiraceae bacterium]|nr:hypothetical protein [Oscillospiraceae bacterium]
MKRLCLLTMLQGAAASLGTVCYFELFMTNVRQRPYAYPFSRAVWLLGGIFLLVTAVLWLRTLLQQDRRIRTALLSVGAGIPVFFLGVAVWSILWEIISKLLPAVEAAF